MNIDLIITILVFSVIALLFYEIRWIRNLKDFQIVVNDGLLIEIDKNDYMNGLLSKQ